MDKQLNTMISSATMATIEEIEKRHKLPKAQFTRSLVEAAVAFYRDKKFFSFPVQIIPEAFQREYIAAEEQAPYSGARALEAQLVAAREGLREKDRAAAAAERKKRRSTRGAAP